MDYIKNPKEIYEKSFAIIKNEADLSRFKRNEQEVAIRLIHSCGMVDIIDGLIFSEGAVQEGQKALNKGAPIICDVEMVAKGIIARNLKQRNEIICALNMKEAKEFAIKNDITRSAAGFELLKSKINGAIIVIGNAPTSLFHLLAMIENEHIKPALILGFPVGFVGASESKQALIDKNSDIPFITLKGRRGGSAMAAAALNGIAKGLAI